jgi:ice-binding like protein
MHSDHPANLPHSPARTRLATGASIAIALIAAACSSDSASRINAPSLPSNSSISQSAASSFAVLANQAVTCTDGSVIGDVGTFQAAPTGSVTLTRCPVIGGIHVGDGAAVQAYNAFLAEYAALAPNVGQCTPANTLTGTLAGQTLTPGTYCISSVAKTGTLTLNGGGEYLFLVDGALTGTNFNVLLTNGAEACDVTWLTSAAATLTTSNFVGTILSGAGITLTGGTFSGNAYAKADVTITGAAVTGCARRGNGNGTDKEKCNQGVGNGPEACDPGNSNHRHGSNDENGGTPGNPGRKGGR